MLIKDRKTTIDVKIKQTKDKLGLSNDDFWCKVYFILANDEFYYEIERKSLSRREILESVEVMRKFSEHELNEKVEIIYIKNYFQIFLRNKEDKKEMELKLISLVDKEEKSYSIYLYDEEIKMFADNAINHFENL